MEYLGPGAWGTLIHENLKSKISCQTPFNIRFTYITLSIWQSGSQSACHSLRTTAFMLYVLLAHAVITKLIGRRDEEFGEGEG